MSKSKYVQLCFWLVITVLLVGSQLNHVIFPTATPTPTPVTPDPEAARALLQPPLSAEAIAEGSKTLIEPTNVSQIQLLAQIGSGLLDAFWWTPDGSQMVLVTDDGTYIYDPLTLERIDFLRGITETSKLPSSLYTHPAYVLDPIGTDGKITVRRQTENTIVRTLEGLLDPDSFPTVQVSPDGQFIVVLARSTLKVIRVADGKPLAAIPAPPINVFRMAMSPDNAYVGAQTVDSLVWIWRLSDRKNIGVLEVPEWFGLMAGSRQQYLIIGSQLSSRTNLWQLDDGGFVRSFAGGRSAAISPDDSILANEGADHSVQLFQMSDGRPIRQLSGHKDKINKITFSPDGSLLAIGSDDFSVRLWRVADGSLVRTISDHTNRVSTVDFSPDGQLLVTAGYDAAVRVWQVADGRKVFAFNMKPGQVGTKQSPIGGMAARFSPDGQTLATWEAYDASMTDTTGYVRLYRVSDWQLLYELSQPAFPFIEGLAFSPDARLIATTGDQVTVWRITDGKQLYSRQGRESFCYGVTFSPDGQLLVTTHRTGLIDIWQASDGGLLREMQGKGDAVAFFAGGKMLVTGGFLLWGIPQF